MTLNTPRSRRPDDLRRRQKCRRLPVAGVAGPAEPVEGQRQAPGGRPGRDVRARIPAQPRRNTLASSQTKSIGLVIDDFRNLWFVDLLRGMESALSPHGYQVTAGGLPARARTASRRPPTACWPCTWRVSSSPPNPASPCLPGTWVPAVVAGWRNGVPAGADLITNDDDGGGRMAAEPPAGARPHPHRTPFRFGRGRRAPA